MRNEYQMMDVTILSIYCQYYVINQNSNLYFSKFSQHFGFKAELSIDCFSTQTPQQSLCSCLSLR